MTTEEKILTFINEMGYLSNEHVIGILFYGSSLTGFNTKNSDIDLHIIFDNEDREHFVRGNKFIDGTRIEYFEKTLNIFIKELKKIIIIKIMPPYLFLVLQKLYMLKMIK